MKPLEIKTPMVPQAIAAEIASIKYKDFEVDTNNEREGNLNQLDGVECSECKNKGKIFYRKNDALYVRDCKCMTKRANIEVAKKSDMENMLHYRLDDYETDEEFRVQVKALANDFLTSNFEKRWFVFLGQPGIGKTHICAAIARRCIEAGYDTKYCEWNMLVNELKRTVMDRDYMKKFEEYSMVRVLYIDDFFKGYVDKESKDTKYAFDLINTRYSKNLVTIISSERLMDDLERIDPSIAGRINQKAGRYLFQVAPDPSKDWRMRKQQ